MHDHLGNVDEYFSDLRVLAQSVEVQFYKQKLHQNQQRFGAKKLEMQGGHDFEFHLLDLVEGDFIVGHLLDDGGDLKREDLFHLAGDQHAGHADEMDVFGEKHLFGFGEKSVQKIHCHEKCVVVATE